MPITNRTPNPIWDLIPEVSSAATPRSTTPSETPEQLISSDTLNWLQIKQPFDLLDEIDKLRSHEISESVSLPQLVVCGDRSSGKSSFLDAITGVPFPCTTSRFTTQLKLRRNPTNQARITIISDSQRKSRDREKLEKFSALISDFSKFLGVVQEAHHVIGFDCDDDEGVFLRDTLSIDIYGPDKPQLTLIDLPWLVRPENVVQSEDHVDFEKALMADERSIMLAVMTTKNNNADQIVLKRVKEADPEGIRTLGIIITTESENETALANLTENKDVNFKLGWHVLLDRNHAERECDFEEKNRTEREFFKTGTWSGVETGIEALASRLSTLYLNLIKRELPRTHQNITNILGDCEREMEMLGQPRSTPEEQRMLLFRASERFGDRCKSAVEGTYEDNFFGFTKDRAEQQKKRLRARVQALNSGFATKMWVKGHSLEIVGSGESVVEFQSNRPQTVTREQAVEWVKPILMECRGRDIPGTFNSRLISELFWEQSKGWENIARRHINKVFRECNDFLKITLKDIAPAGVIDSLFARHIDIKMAERLKSANNELEELLGDRRRYAITYNRSYTDTLQQIRDKRLREQYERAINTALGKSGSPLALTTEQLLQALVAPTKANMDDNMYQEVLDSMLAFYKVACDTFVDNVVTIVVERRLLSHLWHIFSPLSVADMPADTVTAICDEATEDQERRQKLEEKRLDLRGGLEVCERVLKGMKDGQKKLMHEKSSKYMDLEDEDSDEDMTSGNYKTQASPLDPITATSTTVLSALPAVPSTFSNSPFGSSRVPVSLPLASAPPNSWTFGSGYSGVGCSSKLDSRILSSRGGTEGISFPVPRSDALTLSTARSFLPSPTSSRTQRLKLPPSAVSKQPLEPATQIFKAYSEKDNRGQTDIYQNIGFMPEHKGMSMEELRLADYDRDWKFGKDTKIQ